MHTLSNISPAQTRKLFSNPLFLTILIVVIALALFYGATVFVHDLPDWIRRLVIVEFRSHFHGMLFTIPLIVSAVFLWWYGTLVIWAISLLVVMPMAFYYRSLNIMVLENVFYLSIPLLLIAIVTIELNWRKKERGLLMDRENERQANIAQIFRAQEVERKRLAQEIHDDTLHSLLLIASKVQNIAVNKNNLTKAKLQNEAMGVKDSVIQVSNKLRQLAIDLRPGLLDDVGFVAALRWLVDRLKNETHMNAKMVIKGQEVQIPKGMDITLIRIVEESLNNIKLHSQATEVLVTLEFHDAGNVKLEISDNGVGFEVPEKINVFASKSKLGLIGIRERAGSIGTLHIQSGPGQGTRISVECKP